eukprot:gene16248-16427_t
MKARFRSLYLAQPSEAASDGSAPPPGASLTPPKVLGRKRNHRMYVGRIVGVGRTSFGKLAAVYRVSSRSFPNRNAEKTGKSVRIVPRPGSSDAASDSPYISYEAIVWGERFAVVSNGSQTRPIFERLKAGNTPRDAISSVLMGLDREFDQYDTPRICGVIDMAANALWLGSITADSLVVIPITVSAGQLAFITTYNFPIPSNLQVDPSFVPLTGSESCRHIVGNSVFADFEKPIFSTSIIVDNSNIDIAIFNLE